LIEFEQMLVPRMCGKEGGSHGVIPHLLLLVLQITLLV